MLTFERLFNRRAADKINNSRFETGIAVAAG
jgi:hypothetical protein